MRIRSLAKPLAIAALSSLSLVAPSVFSLGAGVAHAAAPVNAGTAQDDPALVIGGGWQHFDSGSTGTFDNQGPFTFTSSTSTSITVVDVGCTGGQYQVFDNGNPIGSTSLPSAPTCATPPYTLSPDVSYASIYFSHGVFTVPAGSHSITIKYIGAAAFSGYGAVRADPFDSTTPTCVISGVDTATTGPLAGHLQVHVTFTDTDNNLSPTLVTELNNGVLDNAPGSATTVPDTNTVGEQIPVTATPTDNVGPAVTTETVTVTKVDSTQGTQFAFVTRDSSLNAITCDPVLTGASRADGKPVTQSVVGIGQADHVVHVVNDAKGVGNLTVTVNGHDYSLHGLGNNQQATLDIGGALQSGTNSVSVKTTGKPGTSATLLFGNI